MPNLNTQTELVENLLEWEKQNKIVQVAMDNNDLFMAEEAQKKIRDIEEKCRSKKRIQYANTK